MVLFSIARVPLLNTPLPVLPEMMLFSMVSVPPLDTPLPVLPEMVLFLMVRVPLFDTTAEILRSESPPLKRQIPGRRGSPGKLPLTAMRPKVGCIPLATNCGAVTFDSDLACNQRQTDGTESSIGS